MSRSTAFCATVMSAVTIVGCGEGSAPAGGGTGSVAAMPSSPQAPPTSPGVPTSHKPLPGPASPEGPTTPAAVPSLPVVVDGPTAPQVDLLADEDPSLLGIGSGAAATPIVNASTSVQPDVAWISQLVPSKSVGWVSADGKLANLNCGPAVAVMERSYLLGTTPTEADLVRALDDFAVRFAARGYRLNSYYGSAVQSDWIVEWLEANGLACERISSARGATIEDLVRELQAGRPPIVLLLAQGGNTGRTMAFTDQAGNVRERHFMILTGIDGPAGTVRVNDPGRSSALEGASRAFSLESFHGVWTSQGRNAIFVRRATVVTTKLQPTSLDFGSVSPGSSAQRTITITNTGTATAIGTVKANPPFSVVGSTDYALQPGESRTFALAFAPTAERSYSGTVSFSGGGGVANVAVVGVGQAVTAPRRSVSTNALAFGDVEAGASKDLTLTLTNVGTGTLTGSATVPAPFSIVQGASYAVGPRKSQTITVRLTAPTSPQSCSATLTFADTDAQPTPVAVNGRSVPATPVTIVDAQGLTYSSLLVGRTRDLSFSVRNGGRGSLTGSVTVNAPFTVVQGGSYVALGPGASQLVTIRFAPTQVGPRSGTVLLLDNGGNASLTATGTGLALASCITPGSGATGTYDPSRIPAGGTLTRGSSSLTSAQVLGAKSALGVVGGNVVIAQSFTVTADPVDATRATINVTCTKLGGGAFQSAGTLEARVGHVWNYPGKASVTVPAGTSSVKLSIPVKVADFDPALGGSTTKVYYSVFYQTSVLPTDPNPGASFYAMPFSVRLP